MAEEDRIVVLEAQVATLKKQVARLKKQARWQGVEVALLGGAVQLMILVGMIG